jgi:hypothetical protein
MAAQPTTANVGVVGVTQNAPVVAVGLDWAVLIPLISAGIGLLVTQILNAVISYKNGKKADAIHILVNSGMTKALADNASQAEEIRNMRALIQSLNERISALPVLAPNDAAAIVPGDSERPSRAEIERAHATIDAGRLPSPDVVAAQASTPKPK